MNRFGQLVSAGITWGAITPVFLLAQDLPRREHAVEFVATLDRHFNERDQAAYLAEFEPDTQPSLLRILRGQLAGLMFSKAIRAKSAVVGFAVRGDLGVALVRTRFPNYSLELHAYTAFRRKDGKSHGAFSLEVDPAPAKRLLDGGGSFSCKGCNYAVDFGADWIAVPVLPSRSDCMESLWLVSLRHDCLIETGVHIGERIMTASDVLQRCINSKRGKQTVVGTEPERAWTPACFDASHPMPAEMTGVRCERECVGGRLAEFNLITLGRLRYLMVVRASREVVNGHREEIDRVLNSFRLLEPTLTAKEMSRRAIRTHTGNGRWTADNRYENQRYGVAIQGPPDWEHEVRAGGFLFELRFRDPGSKAVLMVNAHRANGFAWTTDLVDANIADHLQRHELRAIAGFDTAWHQTSHPTGFAWRQVRTGPSNLLRFAFRSDTIVIMDAVAPDPASLQRIERAMASLAKPD